MDREEVLREIAAVRASMVDSRRSAADAGAVGAGCPAGQTSGTLPPAVEPGHDTPSDARSPQAAEPFASAPELYAAPEPPAAPEQPIAPGTEIDEEWFSGDSEYWDARAAEMEAAERRAMLPPWARAAIAALSCLALVLLMTLPFGGLAQFVDFFVNGAPAAPDQVPQEAKGSAASFVVQESFNYGKDDEAVVNEGAAAQPRYFLTNAGEVTGVKLQSPWQDCWAFAAVAALESSVLKARGAGDAQAEMVKPQLGQLPVEPDYSERHIAWFAHEVQTERGAGEQAGEGRQSASDSPGDQLTGGDLAYADVQITTSQGIVAEGDEPYQYNGYTQDDTPWYQLGYSKGDEPVEGDRADARNRDWSLTDAHSKDRNGVLVKAAHILPSPVMTKRAKSGKIVYEGYDSRATDALKRALVDYGAVAFTYRADVSKPGVELLRYGDGESFSYENWAQFDNAGEPTSNHAAAIVGWDDDYPAENFTGSGSGAPPGNGAWLVKNSWGSVEFYRSLGMSGADARRMASGIDASGFFWLSYYDHTITAPYAFEVAGPQEEGDLANIYQYDYLAVEAAALPVEVSPAPEVCNVFTAGGSEELYAVSARTYAQGTAVEVRVVKMDGDAKTPRDGQVVARQEFTAEYGGFRVFELDEPVALEEGERFAVCERVLKPGSGEAGYLNLETVVDEGDDGIQYFVVSNKGETFVDAGSGWTTPRSMRKLVCDEGIEVSAFGNAMIKAYTRAAG